MVVSKRVKETHRKIKWLEIQGAKNIAISALKALKGLKDEQLEQNINYLYKARPTEPMLRNALKFVLFRVKHGKTIDQTIEEFTDLSDNAIKEIANIGSKRIKKGFNVMTICHSSTVMSVLKEAWNNGIDFKVYIAETRPRFQGRITAKELSEKGIPVSIIVDSAMRYYINKMDLALGGADAITVDGYVINKVGTSMLALAADEARTQFGIATELFKFDPLTIGGEIEPIEERNADEVWKNPPKKVKVLNPAFDMTPPSLIKFMITEAGILASYNAAWAAQTRYRWIKQ